MMMEFKFKVFRADGRYDGSTVQPWRTVLLMHIACFPPCSVALWVVRDIGLVVTEDGRCRTGSGQTEVGGDLFHRLPADLENQYLKAEACRLIRN